MRGLLAHEESGYEEWGASGTVRIDPGASGRGLSLTLSPSWGASSSGVERLWSRHGTAGLDANDNVDPAGRLDAKLGYGFGVPSLRGALTPFTEMQYSADQERLRARMGLSFERPAGAGAGNLSAELVGERIENGGDEPEHRLVLKIRKRFSPGRSAVPSRAVQERFPSSVGNGAAALPAITLRYPGA